MLSFRFTSEITAVRRSLLGRVYACSGVRPRRRESGLRSTKKDAAERQARNVFQHVRVLNGGSDGSLPPGEWRVSGHQNSGNGDGVKVFRPEPPDNHGPGVAHVGLCDLLGGQRFGDGNGAVEIVGMGCAQAGNRAAGLRPRSSEFRMRMDHAADLRELPIEQSVGVQVAGGFNLPSTILPLRSVTIRSSGFMVA